MLVQNFSAVNAPQSEVTPSSARISALAESSGLRSLLLRTSLLRCTTSNHNLGSSSRFMDEGFSGTRIPQIVTAQLLSAGEILFWSLGTYPEGAKNWPGLPPEPRFEQTEGRQCANFIL
ncbi:hypothetical protein EYR41_003766 [Orbilia oligospora]|uniref:Uncharacterized protein n=1 Tax=Orbilia oligospora TaxID=2813651 RepID=A0A8H2HTJ1_ORBOL|nr:hypothetical protein EYR41_003766 [Orbilia oligospora]